MLSLQTWLRLILFCTSHVRILVCFHPSFLCDGMNLSAWALPSSRVVKGQEPASIAPFSYTSGTPQMWAEDTESWDRVGLFVCFPLKFEGSGPLKLDKGWWLQFHPKFLPGVGGALDLCHSLGVFRKRTRELVDSLSKKYLKLLIIVIIVVTKLYRGVLMVSVVLFFIIASIFTHRN